MSQITRRGFLKAGGAAGIGAGIGLHHLATGPAILAAAGPGKATPGEKINLGFIGVAGRGTHHMDWFLKHEDTECAAVCDVYQPHLDAAVKKAEQMKGRNPKAYTDFRKLLEQDDIDAVCVGTPPHWHPLVTIYACQAGKDVYCEKPMCFSPIEAAAMVKAARANHRVTQVGTQIHATGNYHHVVEIVRSGVLGKISRVQCALCLNNAPDGIGNQPNTDPPPGLDWDMWCGPAPLIPFNQTIFESGRHRFMRELIGSWIHEMGPHIVDLPVWAMEMGAPRSASAQGGKFATQDISTIPDTLEATWDYGDFIMTWTNTCASSHGLQFNFGGKGITRRLGISFQGVNGTLLSTYHDQELYIEGERINPEDVPKPPEHTWASHEREFLDAVKSREMCSCDVAYHARVHAPLNLANAAYYAGRKLNWDAEKMEVVGDPEGNALVQPNYRAPWKLPV